MRIRVRTIELVFDDIAVLVHPRPTGTSKRSVGPQSAAGKAICTSRFETPGEAGWADYWEHAMQVQLMSPSRTEFAGEGEGFWIPLMCLICAKLAPAYSERKSCRDGGCYRRPHNTSPAR